MTHAERVTALGQAGVQPGFLLQQSNCQPAAEGGQRVLRSAREAVQLRARARSQQHVQRKLEGQLGAARQGVPQLGDLVLAGRDLWVGQASLDGITELARLKADMAAREVAGDSAELTLR